MNPDNNINNKTIKTSDNSIDDGQDPSYKDSTMLPDFSLSSSTPSTITHDMQNEHQMSFLSTEVTFSIANDNDEVDSRNEEQPTTTSILSQEWLPPAASTPVAATTVATSTRRSEREIENELFRNIENLVREFLRRPNREYPYYRIIRWTIGEQPRLEYVLTVVINRPTVIFQ
jgi:hypothetical protein